MTDTETIKKSGIKAGDVLDMDYGSISISVSAQGKNISLEVDPDNLVSTIRTELKDKEGVEGDY